MKKYPKYKPSGVEWVGDVPEGWEVKSLHWLLSEPLKYGANEPAEDDDPTQPRYIRITDFGDDGKLRDDTFKSLPIEKAQDYFLTEGDILFARSGATVGKTFQFKNYGGKACFAGYLIKASADKEKLLSDFLYYFTKSNGYENWKNAIFNQATIQNIGADKYRSLPTPLPSLPEQTAIAAYLDRKTTQIDQAIAEKEGLIELFREERQAIINQAVTKGIRPGAKMKSSGVEWIGNVPEEWEVKKLKYLASVRPSNIDKKTVEGDVEAFLCNYVDVYKNDQITKGIDFMKATATAAQFEQFRLKKGDVLATKDSEDPADIAVPALVVEDFENVVCGYHLTQIRPNATKLDGSFLFWTFKSQPFNGYFEIEAKGVTRYALSIAAFEGVPIFHPPLPEQTAIAAYLDRKTTQIDQAIAGIRQEIALLQEYRQALIFEAVTGKICVL